METVSKNSFSDSLQNYYVYIESQDEAQVIEKGIRNMDYLDRN